MHTTNLREIGGSVVLTVPRPVLDLLHLEAGALWRKTVWLFRQPRSRDTTSMRC
jgi:hypothetical protein